MPVHIVGESRLIRDMFLAICLSQDYQIGTCCSDLDELPGLTVHDLVLFHSHDGAAGLLERVRLFRDNHHDALLIIVTSEEVPAATQVALSSRAEAIITEQKSAEALIAALKVVQDGYRMIAARAAQTTRTTQGPDSSQTSTAPGPQPTPIRGTLTERERSILQKLTEGGTNKSIANELGICEATVKVHLRTCFRKIGAKNRTQAAIWAADQL
ncbi:response regulator transcription factor [Parasedimentitalea psychrophila]|uniref:Response regulator transcription factor n=1 Tax=Parasedimentitalea psychrophila TaxID=2997337 RepID=A0A9Y2L4X2_9RHOB|nr:response regulator transcription factor [Parasedimentitalea psychrophila]WIY27726.1 response regulator transcription factor [Parasedimentitalea psychrophila]